MHSFLQNTNSKIIVKLNNNNLTEEMKKQAPKEVVQTIDAYFMKNNIITTKLHIIKTLPSGNIDI